MRVGASRSLCGSRRLAQPKSDDERATFLNPNTHLALYLLTHMLKQRISVALLLCDTPSPPVLAAHGTYLPIFTSLLQDSLKNAGREDDVELVVDGYQATDSELPPLSRFEEGKEGSYDAILMTGSGRSHSSLVLSSRC